MEQIELRRMLGEAGRATRTEHLSSLPLNPTRLACSTHADVVVTITMNSPCAIIIIIALPLRRTPITPKSSPPTDRPTNRACQTQRAEAASEMGARIKIRPKELIRQAPPCERRPRAWRGPTSNILEKGKS